jgi:hypothetical protein
MDAPAPKAPLMQCANCHHYRLKMLTAGAEGKCHRYPPLATILPSPGGPITATYWPGPKPVELCGEWKPRLRIADANTQ